MSAIKLVRRSFTGLLFYRVGTTISYQMMMVAVGWHLFDLTNSVISLGLLGLAELTPYFVAALYAGHLVDTRSKKLIAHSACLLHLGVGVFLMCVALHLLEPPVPLIYLGVSFLGIGRALLRPAYQSIFGDLIPRDLTPKYSAYASSFFQGCVVTGPAIGGILIGWVGLEYTYLVAGIFALIGAFGITIINAPVKRHPKSDASIFTSMKEGIHYVRKHPLILSSMSIDMLAVLFGGAVSMLPAFVKDVLQQGPESLGILRAAPAVGAIITSVYFASRPLLLNSGRYLISATAGFGIAIIAFSFTNTLWLAALCLFVSGCFDSVSVVLRVSIFQLTAPDHMRGRISSINGIFVGSSNELGALESGVAASVMGLMPSIAFGGLVTILVAAGFYRYAPALRKLHLKDIVD